mmetsp:Transcript_45874/g.98015  ORF Transcript_45874/g.98015 Transcript_45874/m.98015 type:complete len:531 (+) Transcript_45874:97-1689(+)
MSATSSDDQRRRFTVNNVQGISLDARMSIDLGVNTVPLSEYMNSIGFGWYQVQVFILCSGALIMDGSGLMMISSLVNTWSDGYGSMTISSAAGKGMVMTCVFIGVQIGIVTGGFIGDLFGRRWPLIICYVGSVILSLILSIVIQSASALYAALIFVGLFIGVGYGGAMVFVSEAMPSSWRPAVVAAMGINFRLGHMWSACGCAIFMPTLEHGPWRGLVLWYVLPALLVLILGCFSTVSRHESTYFLAGKRRVRELLDAINCMAEQNGRADKSLVFSGAEECVAKRSNILELVPIAIAYPHWLQAVLLVPIIFSKELVAGGFITFLPKAMRTVNIGNLSEASTEIVIAACGIPGVLIAMCLMQLLPRRRSLQLGVVLTVLGELLMLRSSDAQFLSGAVLQQLFFPSWQMTAMLLPCEIFPTQVKAVWYGIIFFVGRFGALVAPQIINHNIVTYHIVVFALGLLSMVMVELLPETRSVEVHFHSDKDGVIPPLEARMESGSESFPGYGSTQDTQDAQGALPPVDNKRRPALF